MLDHPERAAQSLSIFRSALLLLMGSTAVEAPAGSCRLHLLHLQLRSGSWAAILEHLQCCCFQLGSARFVQIAMEEEVVLKVGKSKPELKFFAISSFRHAVDCKLTFAKVPKCIPWRFTQHTHTFQSIATWGCPSLL